MPLTLRACLRSLLRGGRAMSAKARIRYLRRDRQPGRARLRVIASGLAVLVSISPAAADGFTAIIRGNNAPKFLAIALATVSKKFPQYFISKDRTTATLADPACSQPVP